MINKLNTIISGATEAIKQGKEEYTTKVNDYLNKFSDLKDDAKEKLVQYSQELIQLTPIIEECGYRAKAIQIGLGIPPDIVFKFENFKPITAEERERILEAHKDKELLGIIVKAIVNADNFQSKLAPQKFRMETIDVAIGIPPSISIEMIPRE